MLINENYITSAEITPNEKSHNFFTNFVDRRIVVTSLSNFPVIVHLK